MDDDTPVELAGAVELARALAEADDTTVVAALRRLDSTRHAARMDLIVAYAEYFASLESFGEDEAMHPYHVAGQTRWDREPPATGLPCVICGREENHVSHYNRAGGQTGDAR